MGLVRWLSWLLLFFVCFRNKRPGARILGVFRSGIRADLAGELVPWLLGAHCH